MLRRRLFLSLLGTGLLAFILNRSGFVLAPQKPPSVSPPPQHIQAAVIPHHWVGKTLVEDLGRRLQAQSPSKIYIIGPNHDEVGQGHLITDSPDFAASLSKNNLGALDPDTLSHDHAYTAPKQVLAQFLPQAKFVGILISSRTSFSKRRQLVDLLTSTLTSRDVLVASIDFSHDLPKKEADQYDRLTRQLIESRDTASLLKLNSRSLDSPKALAVFLDYLTNLGLSLDIVDHNNSAQISANLDLPATTSYFEILGY